MVALMELPARARGRVTSSFCTSNHAVILPDGQITWRVSKSLVYPLVQKYFASPRRANQRHNSARLTQTRGGSRSSRTRVEMRWTRQRRREAAIAGRVSRERSTGAQTNGAKARRSLLAKTGCCVRRSRVVLASVADVKLAEMRRPNRAWTSLNPQATVTRGIRHRGERAISRKTIAQGRPDALR
jgi:hypothetical protein